MPRLPTTEEEPAGLRYQEAFLTEAEEHRVLAALRGMELDTFVMRGQESRRTVRHFGFGYRYQSWDLVPTDPWPAGLEWVRERAASLIEAPPERLEQILVTRYPESAGIGWHRDAPAFGPEVVGVSLLSACTMRFQKREAELRRTWSVELAPRSAYVLGGASRSSWQHSIPAAKLERWSITFRTVRSFARPAP